MSGWIPDGASGLELGSGWGRIARHVLSGRGDLVMSDISGTDLSIARRAFGRTYLVQSDAGHIPFKDSCFDYVMAIKMLHFISDPGPVVGEIIRVCRNHGTLIVSIPNLPINRLIRKFNVLPRFAKMFPAFSPARWPLGEVPYPSPDEILFRKGFVRRERRGTGLFDNHLGRKLEKCGRLHLVDVATSGLWFFKPEVLYRFEIVK